MKGAAISLILLGTLIVVVILSPAIISIMINLRN